MIQRIRVTTKNSSIFRRLYTGWLNRVWLTGDINSPQPLVSCTMKLRQTKPTIPYCQSLHTLQKYI